MCVVASCVYWCPCLTAPEAAANSTLDAFRCRSLDMVGLEQGCKAERIWCETDLRVDGVVCALDTTHGGLI